MRKSLAAIVASLGIMAGITGCASEDAGLEDGPVNPGLVEPGPMDPDVDAGAEIQTDARQGEGLGAEQERATEGVVEEEPVQSIPSALQDN